MTKKKKIRSAYDEHMPVTRDCGGESLTEQHHAEACDVNRIIQRARGAGGVIAPSTTPQFFDCPDHLTLGEAIDMVRTGQDEFMKLPAELRQRFNNDYGELVKALEDDEQAPRLRGEFEEMGILQRKEVADEEKEPSTSSVAAVETKDEGVS